MGLDIFSVSSSSPITQRHECYGYQWQPNRNVNDALRGFDTEGEHELPAGITVSFIEHNVQSPGYYFGSQQDGTIPVFRDADASNQLKSIIKTIEENRNETISTGNTLNLLQGYLEYTNKCLNWIYATQNGRTLLDGLVNSDYNVNILPCMGGSSYRNGNIDRALSFGARKIMDPAWRSGGSDQETILKTLASASNKQKYDRYKWLADTINAMPLYSLFKTPPYEYNNAGFLATHWKISPDDIKDWFTRSINSQFAARLENHRHQVKGVKLADFIRAAVIIALHKDSPAGTGCETAVSFRVFVKRNDQNDANRERPPAIGLAHELIHAYYTVRGRQPGVDIYHFTTCLAELMCVGLGPWNNNDISENGIRAQWDPNTIGNGINQYEYDNIDMRQRSRLVYEPTPDNDTERKKKRKKYDTL